MQDIFLNKVSCMTCLYALLGAIPGRDKSMKSIMENFCIGQLIRVEGYSSISVTYSSQDNYESMKEESINPSIRPSTIRQVRCEAQISSNKRLMHLIPYASHSHAWQYFCDDNFFILDLLNG